MRVRTGDMADILNRGHGLRPGLKTLAPSGDDIALAWHGFIVRLWGEILCKVAARFCACGMSGLGASALCGSVDKAKGEWLV